MTQTIRVEYIGQEHVPVVVIDDFVARPDLLSADAAMLRFTPMGPHYPGVRATVAPALVRLFVEPLSNLVRDVFSFGDVEVTEALYSLVTTSPADLTPIQRLPHFDEVEPGRLALLHFLGRGENGGTAFYRHRSTGFERVTAARLPHYRNALAADVAARGHPDPAYIAGDTDIFEEIGMFDGLNNRALLYPSNLLHCARIPVDLNLSGDPATGRLTVNTFLMGH